MKSLKVILCVLLVAVGFMLGYFFDDICMLTRVIFSIENEEIVLDGENYKISNSETAMKIGSAILKDFDREGYNSLKYYKGVELQDDDAWYVYCGPEHHWWQRNIITFGGRISVKFKADTGEIVKLQIED